MEIFCHCSQWNYVKLSIKVCSSILVLFSAKDMLPLEHRYISYNYKAWIGKWWIPILDFLLTFGADLGMNIGVWAVQIRPWNVLYFTCHVCEIAFLKYSLVSLLIWCLSRWSYMSNTCHFQHYWYVQHRQLHVGWWKSPDSRSVDATDIKWNVSLFQKFRRLYNVYD